jgi:hypothetical protein
MPLTAMSHVHNFIPGCGPAEAPLVLLHCSGGNEHELVPLTTDMAPGSPVLAVRGGTPFDGGFAFFHRLPDRSIDEADVVSRAVILADLIGEPPAGNTASPRRPSLSAFHAGGPAPDAPRAAGGCDPIPAAVALPG